MQHLMCFAAFVPLEPGAASSFLEKGANPVRFKPEFDRPKSYFMSLCMSPQIFARKGNLKRIWHTGPNDYYPALMRMQ